MNKKIKYFSKNKFTKLQLLQIEMGIKKGLDVSVYAKPEYDYLQMKQILEDLVENKLVICKFNN